MRRLCRMSLVVLAVLNACAGARIHRALAERTDKYVFAEPISRVWPVAQQILQDHHFVGTSSEGLYHLETPTLTPDGRFPNAGTSPSSPATAGQGQGGRGGQRGLPGSDQAGGEVMRFVVDGEAVDGTHCTVRIVRFTRDNVDAPEVRERDAELEWELVSRVEPNRAAEIRTELAASGIHVP
jgi:hypothetical protein